VFLAAFEKLKISSGFKAYLVSWGFISLSQRI